MRSLLLWLGHPPTRQELNVRDENAEPIPNTCNNECELAFDEAQKVGKTSALCESGSAFQHYYNGCVTCVEANTNITELPSTQAYLTDEFGQYINYCNVASTVNATTVILTSSVGVQIVTMTVTSFELTIEWRTPSSSANTIPASTLSSYYVHLSISSLISGYLPPGLLSELADSVSSAAALASVTGNPTSLVYSALEESPRPPWFTSAVPRTYTAQMSTLEAEIDSVKAGGAYGGKSSNTGTGLSSNAWIAGAVAGPVAAVILFLLGFFLLRRRRRLQRQKQTEGVVEEKLEKAQLHGDSLPIRNPIFELDAAQESHPQELPTVERPQEMLYGGSPQSDEGGVQDYGAASPHTASSSSHSVSDSHRVVPAS